MNKKLAGLAVVVMIGTGALASCSSSDTVSRDDFVNQLTEDGSMTSEQAGCIADGLEREGVALKKFDEPSAEDIQKVQSVTIDCVAADLGIDPAELEGLTSTTEGS